MVTAKRIVHKWTIKETDETPIDILQKELNIHPVLCKLLVQKGVDSFEKAKVYFRPFLEDLHDPFLMKGMEAAVKRLDKAMNDGERIMIYGDYDVDGTTSVALMHSFLSRHYDNLTCYVPDRQGEGYGISTKGIDEAKKQNCTLIIALDCGIRANKKVDYANTLNIDFIICDHHTPGKIVPKALAVLDPKQEDCNYPFKDLSGCGVGFKLCQAFTDYKNLSYDELYELLDLTVVSIACDIVPIVGENRVLAHYGLIKLNENPSPGIANIKQIIEYEKEFSISDIVFKIGPKINAAGRVKHAIDAVNVLIDNLDVSSLAKSNVIRQELDKQTTEEALERLVYSKSEQDKVTTVVSDESWHKGVVGIVASRLMEYYYRPTVVLSQTDDLLTGSARSIANFNVFEPLSACKDLFINFGGHAFAAGLTIKAENLEEFKIRFEQEVQKRITPEIMIPEIVINTEISLGDVTQQFISILNQFAPFGPANDKPIFIIRNLSDFGYSRIVGEGHLKVHLKDDFGNKMAGIGFNLADKLDLLLRSKVDVVCSLEENTWKGNTAIEMMIKDIKLAEN